MIWCKFHRLEQKTPAEWISLDQGRVTEKSILMSPMLGSKVKL